MARAKNLLMLMEWLKLGKVFHIHKSFLLYLDIVETINLCFISKHYFKKYLHYCCCYFIGDNIDLINRCILKTVGAKPEIHYNYDLYLHDANYNTMVIIQKLYKHNRKVKKILQQYLQVKMTEDGCSHPRRSKLPSIQTF